MNKQQTVVSEDATSKQPYQAPAVVDEEAFERKVLLNCAKDPGTACDPDLGGSGPVSS